MPNARFRGQVCRYSCQCQPERNHQRSLLHYARRIEAAGAQALELNVPRFEDLDSLRRQCELRYTSIVRVVKLAVKIPIFTDWSCFIAKAANDTSGRQDHRTSADVPVGTPISLLLACVSES